MRFLLLSLSLATAVAYEPYTGLPAEDVKELSADPAVVFGRLANGIRHAAFRQQQPPGKVALRVLVQHGSIDESDAQRGLAHYLEHMAFNGTTHYPPGTLVKTLQPLGIGFGAHTNAHTGMTETVYQLDLPDVTEATLTLGFTLLADQVGGMLLQAEEIEHERGVILAEMRDRDGPGRRAWKVAAKASYPGLILHDRMPIGVEETIKGATPELIKDFFDTWYRPEHIVVTVAGDIDPAAMAAPIQAAFGAIAARAPARPAPSLGSLQPGLGVCLHRETEDEDTRVEVERIRPEARPIDSIADRRREWAADIGERVLSRRLKDIQERDPKAPFLRGGPSSYHWLGLRHAGVSGTAKPGEAFAALSVLAREFRRMLVHGVTAGELEREAKAMAEEAANAAATATNRPNAAMADGLYRAIDGGRVTTAPATDAERAAAWAKAVTADEVKAALTYAWGPADEPTARVTISLIGRDDPGADAEARLLTLWAEVNSWQPEPPQDTAVAAWGYPLPPASAVPPASAAPAPAAVATLPAGVEQRSAPGFTFVSKRTDFQPGQVVVQLRFQLSRDETPPAVWMQFAGGAWQAGGLGRHAASEISRIFAGSSVGIGGPGFASDVAVVSGGGLAKDLEQLFTRLRATLADPAWRDEAVDRLLTEWRQALDAEPTDLDATMGRRWNALIVSSHPSLLSPDHADLTALNTAAAAGWAQATLAAAPLTVAVVGDVDPEAAFALARRAFGDRTAALPTSYATPEAWREALPPWGGFAAGEHRLAVVAKAPKAVLQVAWPTSDLSDIRRSRRLGLLARCLGERLRERLREELGEAYSPSAWHDASDAWRGLGSLNVVVSVAPGREDVALKVIREEAAKLAASGVAAKDLDQVRPPMLKSIQGQKRQNGWWMNAVSRSAEQPFRLAWVEGIEADFAAATPEEVSALAAAVFVPQRELTLIGISRPAP